MTDTELKRLIRESNLIEGIDDPMEDIQSLFAWEFLASIEPAFFDSRAVRQLQKYITIRQPLPPNARGYYRGEAGNNVNVTVGGRAGAAYGLVRSLMDNWLLDLPGSDPLAMHVRFEHIHPFYDGNGRTGRMLLWRQQLEQGTQPTLFTAAGRQDYYKLFA